MSGPFEWLNGAKQRPRLRFTAWSKNHTGICLHSNGEQQLHRAPSGRPAPSRRPGCSARSRPPRA